MMMMMIMMMMMMVDEHDACFYLLGSHALLHRYYRRSGRTHVFQEIHQHLLGCLTSDTMERTLHD